MAFVSRGANNFLKQVLVNDCARPWYVYVETFVPAFIELLITVHFFDLEDLMRARAQFVAGTPGSGPKRGMKHTRKQRAKVTATRPQRAFRAGLRTLLVITAPLEALGFAYLLYFASDRFWQNWTSLIMKSEFCLQPINAGPVSRSRGAGTIGILTSCDATPMPVLEQNRPGWGTNAFHVELPEGWYVATWALTVEPVGSGSGTMRLRFFINSSLGPFWMDGETAPFAKAQKVDLMIHARFFIPVGGGGSIAWCLQGPSVPAGITCYGGDFTISRVG